MKFFKIAVYVLFAFGFANMCLSLYMFRELSKPNIIVAPDPKVSRLFEDTKARDSQIMQAVLMLHHQTGIHKPGQQDFCPMCAQTQTVEKITKVNN
jgi:hypothetical protein